MLALLLKDVLVLKKRILLFLVAGVILAIKLKI